LLSDVVFAECVFVLESFYEAPRAQVATAMRALLAMPNIATIDASTLFRALAIYEEQRLHFAEAHLVAQAEASGVGKVLSFDRALSRAKTVDWHQP
jgi:predicted nucleic-acid-binding protein